MSNLRIEVEYAGVKVLFEGDTEVVRDLLKQPDQLDPLLAKFASVGVVAQKPTDVATVNGAPKTHSTRFEHWKQQHQLDDALHLALSEVGEETQIVAPVNESSNSKTQLALGLLIGVKNFATNGEPKVPQKELVELCKKYGCFDSGNFSTNMKGKRLTVFGSLRDDSWHLTPAGLIQAAELIRSFAK